MTGPDFSYYPLSTVTEQVRGEVANSNGQTSWRVDYDGILHVTHQPDGGEVEFMTFRLVPVEQQWVEVES